MCGDDHELLHPVILPLRQELVHGAVQRLPSEPGATCEGTSADGHAVGERRRAEDLERTGHLAGHALCDDDVGPQREVRPVLLEGPDRKDQTWIAHERALDLAPWDLVECV